MLEVIAFAISAIQRYVIWIYVACLAGILFHLRNYMLARQARVDTIFTVEREAAIQREGRAMSGIGLLLGLIAIVLVVQFYVLPSVDTTVLVPVTPTPTVPIMTATPRPTMPPTLSVAEEQETRTREAVPMRTPTPQPTETPEVTPTVETPPPPPSPCSNPSICISSPGSNAVVRGVIAIRGTAQHATFQFFKVEYGVGEDPSGWTSIGDTVGHPVENGTLTTLDTAVLPNGVYWLRLTVVDETGNYPPPHRVRITIAN